MKASKILLVAVLGMLLGGLVSAQAAPRAAEASGAHYLIAAQDLDYWHLGGFYRYQDRDAGAGRTFTQNKAAMYVGHDVLPWLAVYGLIGSTRVKLEPGFFGNSDAAAEYGGGLWVNLLDHDILGDLTMESRLRLQAIGQISRCSPEVEGDDISYTEVYSALTLSIITEVIGNKHYWPDAIGLFAGPVYNRLESDEIDDEGSTIGIAAGLDFYITHGVTLSLSYEAFETDGAMNAGLNFRF